MYNHDPDAIKHTVKHTNSAEHRHHENVSPISAATVKGLPGPVEKPRLEYHQKPTRTMTSREAHSQAPDKQKLAADSGQYDDDVDAARDWLTRLGNSQPDLGVASDLPIRPRSSLGNSPHEPSAAGSLLPVFARWVLLWHEKVVHARKYQKNEVDRRQSDLDWLMQYIIGYLKLDHAHLPQADIVGLVQSLIELCKTTSKHRDMENAIVVIYNLLLRWPFPQDSLSPVLQVFCQARAIWRDGQPAHLVQCLRRLLESEAQVSNLNILLSFADLDETSRNDYMSVRSARGSLALLREVVDIKTPDGAFFVTFDQLMPLLLKDAKLRIMKVCTEIVQLCIELVNSKSRLTDSTQHEWSTFTDAIRISAAAFNLDTTSPAATAAESSNNEDLFKEIQAHQSVVDSLVHIFASLLNELPSAQATLVLGYLLERPVLPNEDDCIHILRYANDHRAGNTSGHDWAQQVLRLATVFVANVQSPASARRYAVDIIGESLFQRQPCTSSQGDAIEAENSFWNSTTELLLKRLTSENHPQVFEALVIALGRHNLPNQQATKVIKSLLARFGNKHNADEHASQIACTSASGLSKMFIDYAFEEPEIAQSAFEALVWIVNAAEQSSKARLTAMRLLFAIRCRIDGCVYLVTNLGSEHIAAALCRTEESAEAFAAEDASLNRQSAGVITVSVASSSDSQEAPWMYPGLEVLPSQPGTRGTNLVARGYPLSLHEAELDMGLWLLTLIQRLQQEKNWDTYSFIVVHLGEQLGNTDLFTGCLPTVIKLRQILCEQIRSNTFLEPPSSTGLKRSDVALCLFNVLTPLTAYSTIRSEHVEKAFGDDLVRTFLTGLGGAFEGTSRGCIHALYICALEIPDSVASFYPTIIDRLSKSMSQPHLALDILEFLSQIARLPKVHGNFREEEVTMIFGICIQFLEKTSEQNNPSATALPARVGTPSRQSQVITRRPPFRSAMIQNIGLPQYASALAYHTLIYWFLSLKLEIRAKYVAWILPRLIWKNRQGEEMIDEQSEVCIDMMQRAAFTDLGETKRHPDFARGEQSNVGKISMASWLVGFSIVTVETAGHTGRTQITKRQAAGTTHAIYQQLTASLPHHHAPTNTEIHADQEGVASTQVLPPHVFLQLVGTAAPTTIGEQPIQLPEEEFVNRALVTFDRIPTVDSQKFGILYIDEGQSTEADFLANTSGSSDYHSFLHDIGYAVSLEAPVTFNPQGLESPRDGKTTMAWRDRVAELVFFVPTLMPTNRDDDPYSTTKKMHVGNCHVNIIFNRSGLPWSMDNFKSQFNYVNIVITPPTSQPSNLDEPVARHESQAYNSPAFYKVHLMTRSDIPHTSPAADPKIVSSGQLAWFVRMLAMNADVYCQSWNARAANDREYPSNWRARLQEIKRLKERVLAWRAKNEKDTTVGSSNSTTSWAERGASRSHVIRETQESKGVLAGQLDFSTWTLGQTK